MILATQGNALQNLTKAATSSSGGVNIPCGQLSEALVSELLPQYYSMVKAGKVYTLAAAGITPSSFVGGAAGTPIFGLYNPSNSNVDMVILQARLAIRTTGTAAVATDFNFWSVAQGGTSPTGTQTQPKNMYTQVLSGSVSYAMVGVVNTGALASTLLVPSVSVGLTAATAITDVGVFVDDVKGIIIVSPGSYIAFAQSVPTTGGSFDASLTWAEVPV